MILYSTNNQSELVNFRQALLAGIAPDGGLYLPREWPHLLPGEIDALRGLSYAELAVRLTKLFIGDEFSDEIIEQLVQDAYQLPVPGRPKERQDWNVPTVGIAGRFNILELFHGPTLAFKDFAARWMARLFGYLLKEEGRTATILVATSGDTGSAVANAFHGVPGVRVVVLYPAGKVTQFQEAQMATLGGNITAVSVPGVFDDCQSLVKQAMADPELRSLHLSSANSINIGRLLPQAFYYVKSYLAITPNSDQEVVFSVPSGNLGDLCAGVIAQKIGLPVKCFVAATNANKVLPEFLATGVYQAQPTVETISNAMDVGNPNNFPRLLALHGGSQEAMHQNLYGYSISEAETRKIIRQVYEQKHYALDPHGAVGYAAALRYDAEHPGDEPIVVLETAQPCKFSQVIEEELGFSPKVPDEWQDWEQRKLLNGELQSVQYKEFRKLLMNL